MKDTSSSEVARSFVLAFRVMKLIIEENGKNSWLGCPWDTALNYGGGT
jgi:hypothetical protein